MEASLAPLGVILDLDHTDSVTIPGLGHVANRQYCPHQGYTQVCHHNNDHQCHLQWLCPCDLVYEK